MRRDINTGFGVEKPASCELHEEEANDFMDVSGGVAYMMENDIEIPDWLNELQYHLFEKLDGRLDECSDCVEVFCRENGITYQEYKQGGKEAPEVRIRKILEEVSRNRVRKMLIASIASVRDRLSSAVSRLKDIVVPVKVQISMQRPIDPILIRLGKKYDYIK